MVGGSWNTDLPSNALWTSLRTGHTFVLIVSTVNLLLKVSILKRRIELSKIFQVLDWRFDFLYKKLP